MPKDIWARSRAEKGASLYAAEVSSSYVLMAQDPEVNAQFEKGKAFMDRYGDVFAALARCGASTFAAEAR